MALSTCRPVLDAPQVLQRRPAVGSGRLDGPARTLLHPKLQAKCVITMPTQQGRAGWVGGVVVAVDGIQAHRAFIFHLFFLLLLSFSPAHGQGRKGSCGGVTACWLGPFCSSSSSRIPWSCPCASPCSRCDFSSSSHCHSPPCAAALAAASACPAAFFCC